MNLGASGDQMGMFLSAVGKQTDVTLRYDLNDQMMYHGVTISRTLSGYLMWGSPLPPHVTIKSTPNEHETPFTGCKPADRMGYELECD